MSKLVELYEELIHATADADGVSRAHSLSLRCDRHGLGIEFPRGEILVIDLEQGVFRVLYSDIDTDNPVCLVSLDYTEPESGDYRAQFALRSRLQPKDVPDIVTLAVHEDIELEDVPTVVMRAAERWMRTTPSGHAYRMTAPDELDIVDVLKHYDEPELKACLRADGIFDARVTEPVSWDYHVASGDKEEEDESD